MWDRVGIGENGSSDSPRALPLDALLDRLEAGATLPEVGRALHLDAAELILALGQVALTMDGPGVPALVQEAPRRPWLEPFLNAEAWAGLLPGASRPARLALAAGLLQIHDFWDASHQAAQQADDLGERAVSAYWHGIAHRREPDSGNAAYWFRRVGRHSVLTRMGAAARPLLEVYNDPKMTARLIPGETWDPFAFLDLCSEARAGLSTATLALGLQRVEMMALLGQTAAAVLPAEKGE